MSHFSTIKTQLKEVTPLIKALDQLGYIVNQEKKFVKGYRGQFTAVDISMDLPRETKVGFKWDNNSNSYELELLSHLNPTFVLPGKSMLISTAVNCPL